MKQITMTIEETRRLWRLIRLMSYDAYDESDWNELLNELKDRAIRIRQESETVEIYTADGTFVTTIQD